jgi:hypothetical protein
MADYRALAQALDPYAVDSGAITPDSFKALQNIRTPNLLGMISEIGRGGLSNLESLVRGGVAQVPGTAGDLEALARMGINASFGAGGVNVNQKPVLPTTSDILGMLPQRVTQARPESAGMEELGTVMGPGLAKAAAPAAKGYLSLLGNEINAGLTGQPTRSVVGQITPKPLQIFIGENSKSWNKGAEELALKMEKVGEKPEDIWMATGTFRGPEGKLRQEISDTGAKLTLGNLKPDDYGAIEAKTFEGALEHPRLQQAYPELNDINFQHWPKEQYQGANFDAKENVITMGQKAMEPEMGVALHELQHAIQQKEGFARGGSPSNVLNDWYAGINNELSSLSKQMDALPEFERKFDKSKQAQYAVLRKSYDDLMNKKLYDAPDAEDAYQRLAGEAEARAVQKRMNMSDVQRRVIYPYESYDVPLNKLIIKN